MKIHSNYGETRAHIVVRKQLQDLVSKGVMETVVPLCKCKCLLADTVHTLYNNPYTVQQDRAGEV